MRCLSELVGHSMDGFECRLERLQTATLADHVRTDTRIEKSIKGSGAGGGLDVLRIQCPVGEIEIARRSTHLLTLHHASQLRNSQLATRTSHHHHLPMEATVPDSPTTAELSMGKSS